MELKVKKLNEEAKLPTHGHPHDAGMDFYASETVVFYLVNRIAYRLA